MDVERLASILDANDVFQEFNGYVSVLQSNQVVFEGNYGYANYKEQRKADRDTIYLIGSITKVFTATCIMKLVEENRLSVDDKLERFFPDFIKARDVKISNLLSHTSGIPDYWNRVGISGIDYTDSDAIYRFIRSFDLEGQPGKQFRYCNSNFIILGKLIEKITGANYMDYLYQTILEPLNMNRTGAIPRYRDFANVATGYMRVRPDVKEAAIPEQTIIFGNTYSSGALYSTAADFMKFDIALNENLLISESSKKTMWQPVHGSYGYGWFIEEDKIWHGGDICGFCIRLTKYKNKDITMILMNNVDGNKDRHVGHYAKVIEDAIEEMV